MKERIKKYYLFITVFFILVITALSLLLYHARQEILILIKKQFNEQQSLLAKQTSIGIEENFAIVVRELELLTNMCAVKSVDLEEMQTVMAETFSYAKKYHIRDMGFVDADGILRLALNAPQTVGQDFSGQEYFVKAHNGSKGRPVFEFIDLPNVEEGGENRVVVSMPIISDTNDFGGAVFFVISLHDLITGHSSGADKNSMTWVMDKHGNLLYKPIHTSGVMFNSTVPPSVSLKDFISDVKARGAVQTECISPPGEKVLAASFPAKIADQQWYCIIATPEQNISSLFVRFNSLYANVTFGAIFAIIGGSLLMVFLIIKWNQELQKENSEKIRAENELKVAHEELEQRIEERTAELHEINEFLEKEIGERRIAEAEIVKQNELVKSTIESLSHPFYVIDADSYVIQMANSASNFGALSGSSTCYALTHQKDHPCDCKDHPCTIKEIKQTLKPVIMYHTHYKDGKARIYEVHGYPIFDDQRNVRQVIEYTIDITEKRQLEEQLHQSQKMESIGRLAGGVAHDFNNILTAIIGFSELAQTKLSEDHPVMRDLKIIREAGDKAAILVRKLLAFSRKQVLEMKVINLNELIENMLKLLGRIIGEDVSFDVNTGNEIDNIKADPSQVEQILMNLVINARDAMPDGGRISIETSNIYLGEDYTKNHEGVMPGPYVMLAITDTGKGMSREVQKKIFEPFFTTKGTRGTGLGLATVYGIVKQHKGHVFVYSEEGLGTTFKIYFPATEKTARKKGVISQAAVPMGNEKLLIVDDDDSVRHLIMDTLHPLGYNLIGAACAEEVLEFIARSGAGTTFDLLLTDMVMPGMGGKELAKLVRKKFPQIKIVYMSGYTSDMVADHGMMQTGETFIQKPLSPMNLAGRIREVLDGKKL